MKFPRAAVLVALFMSLSHAMGADQVVLIGKTSIPGNASDKSNLPGNVLSTTGTDTGMPNNTFGSAGSAIDYTGADNIYMMASDRGPSNGDANYLSRVHRVRLLVHPGEAKPVSVELVSTTLLTSATGKNYSGASTAFVGAMGFAEKEDLRLDPEGIRCLRDGSGSFWISDEYGPFVKCFDRAGKNIDSFTLPTKYAVPLKSAVADAELSLNTMGRQTNRGMEGLAITPDGKMLVGIMQNCLLQDHALDKDLRRISVYSRIITMNLLDRSIHEYVYPMESEALGNNEILAINDHQFLVIERDGKAGAAAKAKYIQKIDLAQATDISKPFTVGGKSYDYSGTTAENGMPATGSIPGVTPVAKSLFLDCLSPAGGLAGNDLPEKLEGLAWGPAFDNGDKLLVITTDNDFLPEQETFFYAYRVALTR